MGSDDLKKMVNDLRDLNDKDEFEEAEDLNEEEFISGELPLDRVDTEDSEDDELLHMDGDECGPPTESDIIDDALENIIDMLVENDYSESDANDATFEALGSLIEEGSIEDTPEISDQEELKSAWVKKTIPKIKVKLAEMGLEFE